MSLNLLGMTKDVEGTLQNTLIPTYKDLYKNRGGDSARLVEQQTARARNALYLAADIISSYQKKHNGDLPLGVLENLMYSTDQIKNTPARHVTLAISGWLSKEGGEEKAWQYLTNLVKPSKTAVVAYRWES